MSLAGVPRSPEAEIPGFAITQDPTSSIHAMPSTALELFKEVGVVSTQMHEPQSYWHFIEGLRYDAAIASALGDIGLAAERTGHFSASAPHELAAALDKGAVAIEVKNPYVATYTPPRARWIARFSPADSQQIVTAQTVTIKHKTNEDAQQAAAAWKVLLNAGAQPEAFYDVSTFSAPDSAEHLIEIRELDEFAIRGLRRTLKGSEKQRLKAAGTLLPRNEATAEVAHTFTDAVEQEMLEKNLHFSALQDDAVVSYPDRDTTQSPKRYEQTLLGEASVVLAIIGSGLFKRVDKVVNPDKPSLAEHPNPAARIRAGNLGLNLRREEAEDGTLRRSRQPSLAEKVADGFRQKAQDLAANPRQTAVESALKPFTGKIDVVVKTIDRTIGSLFWGARHVGNFRKWRQYQKLVRADKKKVDAARIQIADIYSRQDDGDQPEQLAE